MNGSSLTTYAHDQWRIAAPALLVSALICWAGPAKVAAQTTDFQIVWVVVGEAEANTGSRSARAGSHLFMASDLMSLSMKNVKVSRIDVAPAVSQIEPGQRLCVSSLSITAYDPGGDLLKSAPLSISVRQDQKQRLALEREKADICVTPTVAGEYPIRFASLLPAPDGTTRGAQIFLRVGEANAAHAVNPDGLSSLTSLSGSLGSSLPVLRSH